MEEQTCFAPQPGAQSKRLGARFLFPLAALLLVGAVPAYAYGDPGSGMLLMQLLLAGLSGLLFYVRRFFRRPRRPGKPENISTPP